MLFPCIICLDNQLIHLYSLQNPELEEWNNESKYANTAKRMNEFFSFQFSYVTVTWTNVNITHLGAGTI